MKRLVAIIFVVAFVIFCVADAIRGFVSSDGFHYFSDQPHRLLLVAVVGIVGGLALFGFSVLSQSLQRRAKLIALGSGGSLVILAGSYFAFRFFNLPPELHSTIPQHTLLTILACCIFIAGLLWLEFYQVLRGRDRVAEPKG